MQAAGNTQTIYDKNLYKYMNIWHLRTHIDICKACYAAWGYIFGTGIHMYLYMYRPHFSFPIPCNSSAFKMRCYILW